jgi:hypothetical protein
MKKRRPRCDFCGRAFTPRRRQGRPQLYCCSSHRQRAYELRRARAQMQGETPMLLLGRDIDTMQTKESIKRAVVEVLRELGFLEGAPKRPPPLRLVEKKPEIESLIYRAHTRPAVTGEPSL